MTRDFPPYAASVAWYAEALNALVSGMSYPGAVGKHPNRTLIAGASSGEWLTVPVAGGAHALKSKSGRPIMLSDHGGWQRRHLAALETSYSRTPYWAHYSPYIADILCEPGDTLAGLCRRIDAFVRKAISLDQTAADIRSGRLTCRVEIPTKWHRHRGLPSDITASDLSILDIIFCCGPEAILAFAPTL